MPAALDFPICGGRYRIRVLLSRSNDDDHKLSDREFLDPDHNRAHPFDIPSACDSKNLEWGVMGLNMTFLYHSASLMKTMVPDANEKMKNGNIVTWRQNDT
jgi:hypothetical protein